jgi:hypothetical protein
VHHASINCSAQFLSGGLMRRFAVLFLAGATLICLCSCGSGNGVGALSIAFTSSQGTVPGGTNVVFSVTTENDTQNRGVNFTLALNEPSNNETTTPCTNACGSISAPSNVITANGPTTYTSITSVTYSAPLLPPTPNTLILTATSNADSSLTTTATFAVGAPQIVVRITNKITTIAPGAAPVTLNAQVKFDTTNAGVTWTLTAQGAACSPACGMLTQAEPFSVIYTPPKSLPAAPNNTPTITATSVADTTQSDFDDISIQAATLPISVSITNPFTQITAGSASVTVNAQVANDIAGQGVTWSLTPSAQTGALSAELPLSVNYTPPNVAPQPPNNTPTITATSVADPAQSASFTFTIEPASSAFRGAYVFWVRASNGKATQVLTGTLSADGAGKITGGEVDVNYDDNRGLRLVSPLLGTYSLSHRPSGSSLISVALQDIELPGPSLERPLLFTIDSNGSLSGFAVTDGQWAIADGIEQQDRSSADLSEFAGQTVGFSLQDDSSGQTIQSGVFSVSGNGAVFSGRATLRFPGSVDKSQEITAGILSGFDNYGRATLTLNFENGSARHFIAYASATRHLALIGADAAPRQGSAVLVAHRNL